MLNKLLTTVILAILLHAPLATLAKVSQGFTEKGIASYYHDRFHGRKTASGERYNKTAYTAAHKFLPLGTHVRVTSLKSGQSIEVKINDRGPFVKGRIIDLSRRAARDLDMIGKGLDKVKIEVITLPERRRS